MGNIHTTSYFSRFDTKSLEVINYGCLYSSYILVLILCIPWLVTSLALSSSGSVTRLRDSTSLPHGMTLLNCNLMHCGSEICQALCPFDFGLLFQN